MNANFHAHTPDVVVIDSRGLPIRQIAYWRADDKRVPEPRVTVQQHDAARYLVAQRDPRFLAPTSRPNMVTVYCLNGVAVLTDSIDSGWSLNLPCDTGQMLERWDGRGSHWQIVYDQQRRLTAVHEQTLGSNSRTIERLTYADNSAEFAERNQCGLLIRHDHPAGVVWLKQQALSSGLICQVQRFLPDLANLHADWPAVEAERDYLLQPGEGNTTESLYGPLNQVLVQTDAGGHQQHFSVDRAGQLQHIALTIKGQTPQLLLKTADYNAEGQLLTQIIGNDVISNATYEVSTGRLERLTTSTPTRQRLQDVSYEYDPVGNIFRLLDHTRPVTFFANQRVTAENTYTYDSLYQLTSAKGHETAGAGQNPGLPVLNIPSPIDPGRLLNYTEYYEYDAGGNRTELRHVSDKNSFRHLMRVDPQSNRALSWNEGEEEPDFKRYMDPNGNLKELVPGAQRMTWNARNQLQGITSVQRSTAVDDGEWYRYNAAGERAVKFSSQQARAVIHQQTVYYLPGLELRKTDDREELQVICVPLARGSVRCLHWTKGQPDGIDIDQLRYSVDDHLGSNSLEFDKHADVISHEGYYPYGGTAWWAASSEINANFKTIRYSGKERDACGLYYYGARYYMAWLGRWVNPDPAGNIDGLNLYKMVGNNPITYIDPLGKTKTKPINKDIHNIWVGEAAEKLSLHVNNINNTVEQADGYKVHLYLETSNEDSYSETIKELKVHDITYLRSSKLFRKFQKTPVAKIYNDFRSGNPKNLAFAVDVFRPYIVKKLGGIYSDVDDIYVGNEHRLGSTSFMAKPDELITSQPVYVPWEAPESLPGLQVNNSSFAAHPGNSVLKDVMKEMALRYKKVVDSNIYSDSNGYIGGGILEKNPTDRMKLMTSMVGPRVFTDVITRRDSEVHSIFLQINKIANGASLTDDFLGKVKTKMPLDRHIKTGSLNSWK